MKHLKLLIAAIAAMTSLSVNAQSWVPAEVGEGYFMLYNVGTGKYLTRGNGWGTQATITQDGNLRNGIALRLAGSGTDFKMFTGINGEAKGIEHLDGGTIYTDQANGKNSTWTFTQVGTDNGGPVYTIVSKDNHSGGAGAYLTAGVDGTKVTPGTDGTTVNAQWKLMSIPAQPIGMDDATETNPVDATSLIVNANFSFDAIKKGDGWTMVSSNYNACGGNVSGGDVIYNPCAESWRASFTLSQALTVPNGIYELTAQAAVTEYDVTGADFPVVYANNQTAPFKAMTNGENAMNLVSNQFTAGNYVVGPIRVVVTNGSLTIGVRGTRTDTWCVWDNFQLTYYGIDLTALRDALQAQIDAVPALEGTTTAAAYNAAKNYADGIDVNALTTEEAISTASTELYNLVNAATALQTNYSRYNAIKTSAKAIATSLDTAIPDAAFDAATTNDAVVAAIASLRATFLAELPNLTIPADPGYIDVTAAMVDNAGVHTNTDYWTIANLSSTGGSAGVCNYGECEFYQRNFKFYQTLALTPGTWEFGVTGFHRAGTYQTYFYAGDDKILIPGVANTVVNSMEAAQTYFNNGNGKVALKFLVENAGNVEIGIDNQDTETDKWTIFRDFTLKYYGAPDYSVYVQEWNDAVAAANTAISENPNVTGDEYTNLTTALANEPADGDKKADYLGKIQALAAATNTFVAAAPNYDALVREIHKAKALGMADADVDIYAATAATTAATALANTQALKVDEYNFVTTNYAYPVALSDNWTSTGNNTSAATFTKEHWSGEQRPYKNQNDNNGQGWNAGSWTLDFNQDVTLPAGSYVFKVAGRRSTGNNITMSLVVKKGEDELGTVSDFPEGSSSLGINKIGVTSFDPNDNEGFANNGNGYGWEWRYVKFDLTEVSTVNIGVSAKATASYQWISFGDYTLQATNADVAALLEALAQYDAALTAANNAKENADYVNVKGSELKALNDAIGADATLDKSTLATVQAAITTLTNATTTFTDAKDSYNALVAAKAYTALTKVTENIGEGVFQYNATTNNDLFSAYETAKGDVDAYDTDDETSTAAAAQALVEALDEAIENYENQPINAPAVGTRYNIVIATPSHAKLNNAVVISLGATSANNPTGYSFNASAAPASYLAQAATFTQVSGNTYNISFETAEGTVYMTYGSLNGSQAGWADSQIQGTTDSDKKGEFLIQATTTENVFNIVNTINNTNIDCQDGGSIYTDVNITKEAFTLAEAQQAVVPVAIAADKYATRIFPFVPVIDGVTFYSCEATEDGTVLELVEVATPQANVPYILKATDAVNVELSGWGLAAADTYTTGWLTGVYAETAVPEGSYVLQTLNGVQAFYAVSSNDPVNAPAYRAYLTAPVAAPANAFFFDFNTTGINAIDALTNGNAVIYDLQGRRVNKAEKGIYIVNGKKVVVK